MKKNNALVLTLVITTILIVSTFGGTAIETFTPTSLESLEVVKEVYDPDGDEWVNTIDAQKGDIVSFKITITYNNITDPAHAHHAEKINVSDFLPECFEYIPGTAVPFEPTAGPGVNEYYWDFTGILNLYDGESLVITFNASIEECCCGEQTNEANAEAYEHCTGKTITGADTAIVNVVCYESRVKLEKIVWDEENEIWAKEIYAKYGEEVRFKIVLNNTGECNLYNFYVNDTLPEGLEYAGDATYPPTYQYDKNISWYSPGPYPPGIEGSVEFNATLIDNIPGNVHINKVEFIGESDECCCPEIVTASDTAKVKVSGMLVEKEVWDDALEAWMESTTSSIGETLRFRITIYYFGDDHLFNIHVEDELPDCLMYANNANPEETEIDGQTIIWDLDEVLFDGDSTVIEFDADVIGYDPCDECECQNWAYVWAEECCGEIYWEDPASVIIICKLTADAGGPYTGEVDTPVSIIGEAFNGNIPYTFEWDMDEDGEYDDATGDEISWTWEFPGIYTIWLRVTDDDGKQAEDYAIVTITVDNNPPTDLSISGRSSNLNTGVKYNYKVNATDPEGDDIYYYIDWGDGDTVEWAGPFNTSEEQIFNHSWTGSQTTYNIRVKAKDIYDDESDWVTLQVSTQQAKNSFSIIYRLLERFPILQKLLQYPLFQKIFGL